uniref:PLD phosphodiesterase domain-containing protein n=1 Tax=Globodera pallida TaxID=36090 RepID=A0A183CBA3_GLOPA
MLCCMFRLSIWNKQVVCTNTTCTPCHILLAEMLSAAAAAAAQFLSVNHLTRLLRFHEGNLWRHCCPPSGDVVVPWRSGGDKIIAKVQISLEIRFPFLLIICTQTFLRHISSTVLEASVTKLSKKWKMLRPVGRTTAVTPNVQGEGDWKTKRSPSRKSRLPALPLLAALALFGIVTALLIQLPAFRVRSRIGTDGPVPIHQMDPQMIECAKTCRIELVETIPQNVSFYRHPTSTDQPILSSHSLAIPTSSAWMRLIGEAKHSLAIAAYKTSLRGKHVLGEQNRSNFSAHGEMVFDALLRAGLERGVGIRMVENAVAKDKGDNEDGFSLYRRGALARRLLNIQRIYHTGVMHSKFIVADGRHFYLGSANMDWRSLSQKMELGVMVRDCPCLAQDLLSIFEVYWRASDAKTATKMHAQVKKLPPAKFNPQRPLKLMDGEQLVELLELYGVAKKFLKCRGKENELR